MADVTVRFIAVTDQYEAALAGLNRLNQQVATSISQTATQAQQSLSSLAAKTEAATKSVSDAYQRNAQVFQDSVRQQDSIASSYAASLNRYQQGVQQFIQGMGATTLATANNVRQAAVAFGQAVADVSTGGEAAKAVLDRVGSALNKFILISGAVGAALTAPFILGVHEATVFEDAMLGLRRVMGDFGGASDEVHEGFLNIAQGLRDISAESGKATTELAGIAEQAVRLGLKGQDDILKFTDAIQKVSQVTGIAGPTVAREMGNLARAMDFPIDQMDKLGSAVVRVGELTQASDREILSLTQSLSAAGKAAGLSVPDMLALSAAIAATGTNSGMASMAMNQLLLRMTKAVEEGSAVVGLFAKVASLIDDSVQSAQDFTSLFKANPFQALTLFLQGLNAAGERATVILDQADVGGQRVAKTLLQVAQASQKMTQVQTEANKAIRDGTTLQERYALVQSTLKSILEDVERATQAALVEAYQDALPWLKAAGNALLVVINTAREHPVIMKLGAAVAAAAGGFSLLASAAGVTAKGVLETAASFGTITTAVIELQGKGYFTKIADGFKGIIALAPRAAALISAMAGAFAEGGFAAAAGMITPGGWLLLGIGALVTALTLLEMKTGLVSKAFGYVVEKADEATSSLASFARGAAAIADEEVWQRLKGAANTAIQFIIDKFSEAKASIPQEQKDWITEFGTWFIDWAQRTATSVGYYLVSPFIDLYRYVQSHDPKKTLKDIGDGAHEMASPWIDAMQGLNEQIATTGATAGKTAADLKAMFPGRETFEAAQDAARKLIADFQAMQVKANALIQLQTQEGTLSQREALDARAVLLEQETENVEAAYKRQMAALNKFKDEDEKKGKELTERHKVDLARLEAENIKISSDRSKLVQGNLEAQAKMIEDLTDEQRKLYNTDYDNFVQAQDKKLRELEQTLLPRISDLSGEVQNELLGIFKTGALQGQTPADQIEAFVNRVEGLRAVGKISDEVYQALQRPIAAIGVLKDAWLSMSDLVEKSRIDWDRALHTAGQFGDELDKQTAAFARYGRGYETLTDAEKQEADQRAAALKQIRAYSVEQEILSKDVDAAAIALKAETDAFGLWGEAAEKALLVAQRSKGNLTFADLQPETQAKVNKMFDDRAQETLLKSLREAKQATAAEEAAFGKLGVAADVQRYAIEKLGRAYNDLDPLHKAEVLLIVLETRRREDLAVASSLNVASYGQITKAMGLEMAQRARNIDEMEREEQRTIETLDKINGAWQRHAVNQAKIQQGIAENHNDIFGFMLATTRLYVAQSDTLFQGLGKAIINTFSAASSALSDVFFNVFTGQAVKLQDVWKNLMNAMLRELSNFLASQAVRLFLAMLFGTAEGEGGGLAQGAAKFGSMLGGGTGTAGLLGGLAKAFGIGSGAPSTATTTVSAASGAGSNFSLGAGNTKLTDPTAGFSINTSGGTSGGSGFSLFGGGTSAPLATSMSSGIDWSSFGIDLSTVSSGIDASALSGDWSTFELSEGGRVPGAGRGDIVPAMLEPGEFVVKRDVAQQHMDTLLTLNNGGRGARVYAGGAYMAEGGVVPSITGDQAVLNLLYAMLQQQIKTTSAVQATATNTGSTAAALGQVAAAPSTASVTTLSGVGGNVTPGTAAATTAASGGSTAGGSSTTDSILGLIKGSTGLARTGSNVVTGLTDTSKVTANNINAAFGLLSGSVGLASGISSGNTLQAAGGGLQALSGLTRFSGTQSLLNTTFGSNLLGSGATAIGAGQIASSALGVAGGGLGLYASIADMIQHGASASGVINAVLSAYSVYASAAPVISAVTGQALPTVGSLVSGLIGTEVAASAAPGITAATTAGVTGGEVALGATAETGAVVAGEAIGGSAAATFAVVLAPIIVGYLANAIGEMVARGQAMKQAVARYEGLATAVPEYLQGMQTLARASVAFDPSVATPEQASALYKAIGDFTEAYRANGVEDFIKFGTTVGAGNYKDVQIDFQQSDQVLAALAPMQQAIRIGAIRALDVMGRAGMTPPVVPAGSGFYTDPRMLVLSQLPTNTGLILPSSGIGSSTQALLLPGFTQVADPMSNSQGLMLNVANPLWSAITGLQPGNLESGIAQISTAALGGQLGSPVQSLQAAQAVQTAATTGYSSTIQGYYTQAFNDAVIAGLGLDAASASAAAASGEAYQAFTSGGMAQGGWVTGGIPGRDSVLKKLMPGEFVVPATAARRVKPMLDQIAATGGAPGGGVASMPITITINVNGNADDPQKLARTLAPALRDELRRIEPRFSRAGNKLQV